MHTGGRLKQKQSLCRGRHLLLALQQPVRDAWLEYSVLVGRAVFSCRLADALQALPRPSLVCQDEDVFAAK